MLTCFYVKGSQNHMCPALVIYLAQMNCFCQLIITLQKTSNPNFLSTLTFRASDGFDMESRICFIVCDVQERVTDASVHLGKTLVILI